MATFASWLKKQHRRADAVGDLARDVRADRCFPASARTLERIWKHLSEHNASEGALNAAEQAWREYCQNDGRESVIYLSISDCPPERTVYGYETEQEARAAKQQIDQTGCGHQCRGASRHLITKTPRQKE